MPRRRLMPLYSDVNVIVSLRAASRTKSRACSIRTIVCIGPVRSCGGETVTG